nr:hypothetical protein Cduv_125 [Cedratvirus duvanny]
MLPIYSTILSLHEEPKDMYKVCFLFMNILSSKSFWKERQEREHLPFVSVEGLHPLRMYYLTKEFASKEVVLSCHLSELPFFPSFASGEEYYARAVKFRREQIHANMNPVLALICSYQTQGGGGRVYNYTLAKKTIDNMISSIERDLGVKDPEHPSLNVSVKLYRTKSDRTKSDRTEFANYCFYLYMDLVDEEGNKVDIPVESTLISMEQALSFYLSSV